jgi:glycosyltransferase involved in cell wall biosynthesis
MKILFLNPGGQAQGGAEKSLIALIEELTKRGHECLIMVFAPGDALDAFVDAGAKAVGSHTQALGGANRHQGGLQFALGALATGPSAIKAIRNIRRVAKENDVDIIHSNGFRTHVLTPFLKHINKQGPKIIWSVRDFAPSRHQQRLLRTCARAANAIAANSNFTASQFNGMSLPVRSVGNPVTIGELPSRQQARTALRVDIDRKVAAIISHLHPSKGHQVAIDAIGQIKPSNRPLLVIAGGHLYGQSSIHYESELRRRVDEQQLGADVKFVGNQRDISTVLAATDIVLQPPLHPEGFGRVAVEAQLAGRPVIATNIGGAVELIEDEVSGILVAPNDPEAIAKAIERIVDDPQAAQQMVENAKVAAQRFSPSAHADAVLQIYESSRE